MPIQLQVVEFFCMSSNVAVFINFFSNSLYDFQLWVCRILYLGLYLFGSCAAFSFTKLQSLEL